GSLALRPLRIQSGAGWAAVLPARGSDDHWSRADWASHDGTGSVPRSRSCPSEAWCGADGLAAGGAAVTGGATWAVPAKPVPSKAVHWPAVAPWNGADGGTDTAEPY